MTYDTEMIRAHVFRRTTRIARLAYTSQVVASSVVSMPFRRRSPGAVPSSEHVLWIQRSLEATQRGAELRSLAALQQLSTVLADAVMMAEASACSQVCLARNVLKSSETLERTIGLQTARVDSQVHVQNATLAVELRQSTGEEGPPGEVQREVLCFHSSLHGWPHLTELRPGHHGLERLSQDPVVDAEIPDVGDRKCQSVARLARGGAAPDAANLGKERLQCAPLRGHLSAAAFEDQCAS